MLKFINFFFKNKIGIAKTGSGKTLAFLLPMFRHIVAQDPILDTDGPMALLLAPTREVCFILLMI